jgi:hypothetical protein
MSGTHTGREMRRAVPARSGGPGQGRPAWQSASISLLRANWPAVALLAAGLVLRVLAQVAYRPAIFYIDTPRYFYNIPAGQDPLGYGGILRAILVAGNLDVVVAVQHLLGLAMAVVIYALLRRRGVGRWLGALAIAPVLLDAYQIQIEQNLMPDVWFEAFIVAGLAILLWRPTVGWRRAAVAGVVLGASATVAQVGEALLLPAVIYLLALGGGWRRAIGRTAAACVAFAAPILAYSTGSYLATGAFQLSHTGVTSFYGRAAAAVDCGTIRLPAAERGMCPTKAQQRRGPDWLEYAPGSPIRRYYDPRNQPIALTNSQLSDFNHRVLSQQPLPLLSAYGRDVVKLFALTRSQSPGDTPISRWQFQTSYRYFPPWTAVTKVDSAISQFGGGSPAVWSPVAAFLRAYQLDGGYTPGPLFAIFTIAGLAGSLVLARRRLEPGARQLGLACLLFFASGVFVLLVSDLFEFSWRYQLPCLVTSAPAGALGIAVLGRRLGRSG